jgi:hypothetical protein
LTGIDDITYIRRYPTLAGGPEAVPAVSHATARKIAATFSAAVAAAGAGHLPHRCVRTENPD